ncbi:MAG: hypothetical protein QOD83_1309 [Solirubrobacteraceae bacterium]|nr:hypothetical protein [Solirubrobacteraceae bacterium]
MVVVRVVCVRVGFVVVRVGCVRVLVPVVGVGVVVVPVVCVRDGVVVPVVCVCAGVVCVVVAVAVWPGTGAAGAVVPVGTVLVVVGRVVVAAGGAVVAGAIRCAAGAGAEAAGAAPLSPVSLTKANASIAAAIATIAPIATVGSCQFGVGASRVRAGAPHSRHQSWSGSRFAEQRGQRIDPGGGNSLGGVGSRGWALTPVPRRSSGDHAASSGGRSRSVGGDVLGDSERGRLVIVAAVGCSAGAAACAAAGGGGACGGAAIAPPTSPIARGPPSCRPQCGQKFASLECSAPQRAHEEIPGSRSS